MLLHLRCEKLRKLNEKCENSDSHGCDPEDEYSTHL
jgi:hypothetical protein